MVLLFHFGNGGNGAERIRQPTLNELCHVQITVVSYI